MKIFTVDLQRILKKAVEDYIKENKDYPKGLEKIPTIVYNAYEEYCNTFLLKYLQSKGLKKNVLIHFHKEFYGTRNIAASVDPWFIKGASKLGAHDFHIEINYLFLKDIVPILIKQNSVKFAAANIVDTLVHETIHIAQAVEGSFTVLGTLTPNQKENIKNSKKFFKKIELGAFKLEKHVSELYKNLNNMLTKIKVEGEAMFFSKRVMQFSLSKRKMHQKIFEQLQRDTFNSLGVHDGLVVKNFVVGDLGRILDGLKLYHTFLLDISSTKANKSNYQKLSNIANYAEEVSKKLMEYSKNISLTTRVIHDLGSVIVYTLFYNHRFDPQLSAREMIKRCVDLKFQENWSFLNESIASMDKLVTEIDNEFAVIKKLVPTERSHIKEIKNKLNLTSKKP